MRAGGVVSSDAAEELREFADKIQAPVTLSVMGLTSFPAKERLCAGLIGMHGSFAAARAVTDCDLMIAVGARFSDRVAGNRGAFAKKRQSAADRHRRGGDR